MLNKNQTKKYVLYALGEIFLVVIGILIALQINNWNQNRIARIEEQKILKKIRVDLTAADSINKKTLSDFNKYQNLHRQIFNEMRGKATRDTTQTYHSLWWYSVYTPIISQNHKKDVAVLTNESAREALADYLEQEINIIKAFKKWDDIKIEEVRPFINRNNIKDVDAMLSSSNYWQDIINKKFDMINYNRLKAQYTSEEFEQILGSIYSMTSYLLQLLDKQAVTIDSFKNVLDAEIEEYNQ